MITITKELAAKLLIFQYKNLGYGKYSCTSCGALKYVDYGDNDIPPSITKIEECSKNCPWKQLRNATVTE